MTKLLLLAALGGTALPAVELEVRYNALERLLASQMFTQEGRKYVRGNPQTKCDFAYLESPRVRGRAGRLHIEARFSGRRAMDFFGRCIGLGDSFDVAIDALPVYREGAITLAAVAVASPGEDSFYVRRVRSAMEKSLGAQFSYRIADDARRMLEETRSPGLRQQLRRFEVVEIRVTGEGLVLRLDFALTVEGR